MIDAFLREEMEARLKLRDTTILVKKMGRHGIPYAERIEWIKTGIKPASGEGNLEVTDTINNTIIEDEQNESQEQ